jgi:hypothetical protein
MIDTSRHTEVSTLTRSQSAGLAFTIMGAILTAIAGSIAGAGLFDPNGPKWMMLVAPPLGLLCVWFASRSTLPQKISRSQSTGLLLIMTSALLTAMAGGLTGAFFIQGDQEIAFTLSLLVTVIIIWFLHEATFVTFTSK